MSATPKTIQIFLPSGDPRGIRVAEITTRIVQVIEVPRSLLQDFLKMPESEQVALYFLFGESEDGAEQKVYIGQTGDLRARLTKHNKEKEFWERALVLISRTNSLTQTHALFLEWHCLQSARQAGRLHRRERQRGQQGAYARPAGGGLPRDFREGHTLLATLGYPLFDPVAKSAASRADDIFYCTSSASKRSGMYTQEGFVVLKGSVGRKEVNVPSIIGTAGERLRSRLLESGVMRVDGDSIVFERDHLFRSPSMAALALIGRTSNGWVDWKTKAGKTLDAVKRQSNNE